MGLGSSEARRKRMPRDRLPFIPPVGQYGKEKKVNQFVPERYGASLRTSNTSKGMKGSSRLLVRAIAMEAVGETAKHQR